MLKPIDNIDTFKEDVKISIHKLSDDNPELRSLTRRLLKLGSLFVVGGYLRNVANHGTDPRDIDFISSLEPEQLVKTLTALNLTYSINRMQGVKVTCGSFFIDIWSLNSNWSFSNNRIKWEENGQYRADILLKKIADGLFFNCDSLVLDMRTYHCSVSNYNDFVHNNTLDILRKLGKYKYQNPTREANILRAFFLQKSLNVNLSENTKTYILNELKNINYLKDQNPIDLILSKSEDYRNKYKAVASREELTRFILSLKEDIGPLFAL